MGRRTVGRGSLTRIAAIFLVGALAQLDGVNPSAAQTSFPTRFEATPEGATVQSVSGLRVVTTRDYRQKVSLVVTPQTADQFLRVVMASDDTHVTGVIKVFSAQRDGSANGFRESVFSALYDLDANGFEYFDIANTESSGSPPGTAMSFAFNEISLQPSTAANQDLMTVWVEVFANEDVTFVESF